jgi:uncharacterized repeat protein (TIGR02543 family)
VYPAPADSTDAPANWTDATAAANLAAEGETIAKDLSTAIDLTAPNGVRFAETGLYIAVITMAANGTRDAESRYGIVQFTDGSAAVEWASMTEAPEETAVAGGISLEVSPETGTGYTFPFMQVLGTPPPARTVRITNTGTEPTGPLSLTLFGSGAAGFKLSTDTIEIAPMAAAEFDVQPVRGLDAGEYAASVRISGGSVLLASFGVVCKVMEKVPDFGISVSQREDYTFDAAVTGAPDTQSLKVTVTGMGSSSSGGIAVSLSGTGASAFLLSADMLSGLASGKTADFTVSTAPMAEPGEYSALVKVASAVNPTVFDPAVFNVKITVIEPDADYYALRLSQTATHDFYPPLPTGYGSGALATLIPEPLTVTVTNVGSRPTGPLTITTGKQFGTNRTGGFGSLAVGQSAKFTVTPVSGLPTARYEGTITVSNAENKISAAFKVSFEVINRTYGISLDPSESFKFTDATEGLEYPAASKIIRVTNTGNTQTERLAATLSGNTPEAFEVSPGLIDSIPPASSASITLTPKPDLPPGDYTAVLTVGGSATYGNAQLEAKSVSIEFAVRARNKAFITISPKTDHIFQPQGEGYDTAPYLEVAINNEGNAPSLPIDVKLIAETEGDTPMSFGLDTPGTATPSLSQLLRLPNIAAGTASVFRVAPKTKLSAGNYGTTVYTALVTVSVLQASAGTAPSAASLETKAIGVSGAADGSTVSRAYAEIAEGQGGSFRVSFTVTKQYTVSFDLRGGTVTDSGASELPIQRLSYGETAQYPGTVEKPDCIFDAWYDADTSQPFDFAAPVTKDISLYAVWK